MVLNSLQIRVFLGNGCMLTYTRACGYHLNFSALIPIQKIDEKLVYCVVPLILLMPPIPPYHTNRPELHYDSCSLRFIFDHLSPIIEVYNGYTKLNYTVYLSLGLLHPHVYALSSHGDNFSNKKPFLHCRSIVG